MDNIRLQGVRSPWVLFSYVRDGSQAYRGYWCHIEEKNPESVPLSHTKARRWIQFKVWISGWAFIPKFVQLWLRIKNPPLFFFLPLTKIMNKADKLGTFLVTFKNQNCQKNFIIINWPPNQIFFLRLTMV